MSMHRHVVAVALLTLLPWSGAGGAVPRTVDEVVAGLRRSNAEVEAEDRRREERFLAERRAAAERLAELERELKAEQARGDGLRAAFERNEDSLAAQAAKLEERTAGLADLFAAFRQAAGDGRAMLASSLVAAERPERYAAMARLAEGSEQPTMAELEMLFALVLDEMVQAGRVSTFTTTVVDATGRLQVQTVTRCGSFTAVAGDRFLGMAPEGGRLYELARQPSPLHRACAATFASSASGEEPAAMVVDPSRGVLLTLLGQVPTPSERIRQGGVIGYVIIAIAALGLLLALERLVWLFVVGRRMHRQSGRLERPTDDNPLGRVLLAGGAVQTESAEVVERRLDEAVLNELPALERGCGALKLFYTVTPLLGLLGTVTGMIGTFQAITLFGTGDPKLMAGGISEALVTTALGLTAAIPLVFCHSIVASTGARLIDMLEHQSAAFVAGCAAEAP